MALSGVWAFEPVLSDHHTDMNTSLVWLSIPCCHRTGNFARRRDARSLETWKRWPSGTAIPSKVSQHWNTVSPDTSGCQGCSSFNYTIPNDPSSYASSTPSQVPYSAFNVGPKTRGAGGLVASPETSFPAASASDHAFRYVLRLGLVIRVAVVD